MAKVYGGIEGINAPEFGDGSWDSYEKREADYIETVKEYCKKNSKCPDAGKIIGFPIADGKAQYCILDYRTLIHINTGDGYAIPEAHARGLRKADIVKEVKKDEAWAEMMSKHRQRKSDVS